MNLFYSDSDFGDDNDSMYLYEGILYKRLSYQSDYFFVLIYDFDCFDFRLGAIVEIEDWDKLVLLPNNRDIIYQYIFTLYQKNE